jgi:hypothetical protein
MTTSGMRLHLQEGTHFASVPAAPCSPRLQFVETSRYHFHRI